MTIAVVVVLALAALSAGSLTVASLALADLFSGWGVFFFYTVPAVFFTAWAVRELAPGVWRKVAAPWRWGWRRSKIGRLTLRQPAPPTVPEDRPPAPSEPLAGERGDEPPPGPGGEVVGFSRAVLRAVARPWLLLMRWFLLLWRSPAGRRTVSVSFGLGALGILALVALELYRRGWPIDRVDVSLGAAGGALFLATYGFKALGWQRVFRAYERPRSLALAAATGAAAVTGLALPGRMDDAVRVAILRRMPGRRPGVGTLVLSLLLLGMVDAAALAPLAAVAAATSGTGSVARIGLAVVAGAGVGAGIVLAALPRISASERLGRFRLTHWLNRHTPASPRDAGWAFGFVFLAWAARAAGVFVLLGAVGFQATFGLALAYVAAGAASGALPIAPAAAATQAGIGAAVLATAGIGAAEAVAFAIAAQALTVLAGGAVVAFAALVHLARLAVPAPAG